MARTPHRWRWPDLFIETYMYDHRDHRMRLIYSLISFAEGIVMIADEVFMRYIPAFCISHGLCFFRGRFRFGFWFSVFGFWFFPDRSPGRHYPLSLAFSLLQSGTVIRAEKGNRPESIREMKPKMWEIDFGMVSESPEAHLGCGNTHNHICIYPHGWCRKYEILSVWN